MSGAKRGLVVSGILLIAATSACTAADDPLPSPTPGGASTASVIRSTQVGPEPSRIALGEGSIWVGDDFGVERIDPATGGVIASVNVGAIADVAVGPEGVWITSYAEDSVARVDPTTNSITEEVQVDAPTGVAVGLGSVWIASRGTGTVSRLDPDTGEVVSWVVFDRDADPSASAPMGLFAAPVPGPEIAVGAGAVWVADQDDHTLVRIDPDDGSVTRIDIDGGPSAVVATDERVWVANPDAGEIASVDAASGSVDATIGVGGQPRSITVTDDQIWAAGDGFLVRIDPTSPGISLRLSVDGVIGAVAIVDGHPWTAVTVVPNDNFYDPGDHVLEIDPDGQGVPPSTPATGEPIRLPVAVAHGVAFTEPLDDGPLALDVYAPPGATDLPVIVFAHGSPCGPGCRDYLASQSSTLALRGAVVFNADYRDILGTAKQQASDIACAVAFARANAVRYGGSANRVTLVGHSTGSARGGTVALGGAAPSGTCLADGPGLPDAFVGIAERPTIPRSPGNQGVSIALIAGAEDDLAATGTPRSMEEAAARLRELGYLAAFTLVRGGNHFTTFDPGRVSPALDIIMRLAR